VLNILWYVTGEKTCNKYLPLIENCYLLVWDDL